MQQQTLRIQSFPKRWRQAPPDWLLNRLAQIRPRWHDNEPKHFEHGHSMLSGVDFVVEKYRSAEAPIAFPCRDGRPGLRIRPPTPISSAHFSPTASILACLSVHLLAIMLEVKH